MRYIRAIGLVSLSVLIAVSCSSSHISATTVPGVNERIDVTASGIAGNSGSGAGSISRDGRYVAFSSYSSNLVPNDTNNQTDIFVKDRTANTITRVSVASDGTQSNNYSQGMPSISDNGRYVVFNSDASNLVPGDTNAQLDIFVHDMQLGTTALVDTSSAGVLANDASQEPTISGDGKFVVFESNATNLVSGSSTHSNIYVKNLQTGSLQLISQVGSTGSNADSWTPSISCDGGIVSFYSYATNLSSNDTNGKSDVFIDVRAGGDTLSNITSAGNNNSAYPMVSCDGMSIAFVSQATNLASNATNGSQQVYKYDRRSQDNLLVSSDSNGVQANASSYGPAISADGRLVAFSSSATNLVSNDNNSFDDTFIRDTDTSTTSLVSVSSTGQQANGNSYVTSNAGPAISGNGKYLLYNSAASNLISGQTMSTNGLYMSQTGL